MPKKTARTAKSKRAPTPPKKTRAAKSKSKKKKVSAVEDNPRKRGLGGFLLHSNDELQTWVARIEDVCEELDELMIEAGEKPLTVDLASLDRVERFLLERYPTLDAALTLHERGVVDAASRHVGRFIQVATNGSKWALNLDDPDEVHYRLPVVQFNDGTNESPLTMITTSLSRRTGTFMRGLAKVIIEDYGE
jgi:hypothetical protein